MFDRMRAAIDSGGEMKAGWSSVFDGTTVSVAAVLTVLLAGCTAILETNKVQCSADQDCVDLFGADSTQVCVQHVCERPFCQADSDCKRRGERFGKSICDEATHECVKGECAAPDECGSGRACNLATNRCVTRECTVTQNCLNIDTQSPTMECIDGFCVDDAWGCLGDPDNRPHEPGAKGTLRVPLYDPLKNGPLEGSLWETRVCLFSDKECTSPLDVPTSYDPATGIVTVEQLDSDQPVRLWLTLTNLPESGRLNGKAAVDMEFITQKPPVGITTTPPLRVVTWKWIASLIESYRQGGVITGNSDSLAQVFRLGTQTIFGDAFDCQDRPASNLFVKIKDETGTDLVPGLPTDPLAAYTPYFWDEQNIAYTPPTRNFTFGTGVWSTANLPVAKELTLRSHLVVDEGSNDSRIIRDDVPIYMHVARMMTIHLYPRSYGLPSAP